MANFDLLISILTLNEVKYLAPMAKEWREQGNNVGFILFHEGGEGILRKYEIPFFNMFAEVAKTEPSDPSLEQIEELRKVWGIGNISDLYIHEKMGYGRPDGIPLGKKVYRYLIALDRLFTENNVKAVLQELGGFTPNHAVYQTARKNGIPHLFYEPAPFKKRVIFNRDTYFSDIPEEIMNAGTTEDTRKSVASYISDYLREQSVIKPFKDAHRYKDQSLGKIFNIDNAKRLWGKIRHKYIEGKKEEYSEIGWVIRDAFKKYFRRKLISSKYEQPDYGEPYVYYPFHVPYDVQLSSRCPLFYNQEGFVEYLCRSVPHGWKVYIKEHPTCIGGHSYSILRKMLGLHKNLVLIHPGVNSFELIKHSRMVMTVNSKVGFEALMQRKKVVVLGDVFYKNKGVTFDCYNLKELPDIIRKAAEGEAPTQEAVEKFIQKAWDWSYPAELFLITDDNMSVSTETFTKALKENRFLR